MKNLWILPLFGLLLVVGFSLASCKHTLSSAKPIFTERDAITIVQQHFTDICGTEGKNIIANSNWEARYVDGVWNVMAVYRDGTVRLWTFEENTSSVKLRN
ncbi:hypothetical protein ACFLWX_03150 [Chloroflexota bacterium]